MSSIIWMMSRFGPKGLEFARTRVEMKHTEGILNLRHERPHRLRGMVPDFAWRLAAPYGLFAAPHEVPRAIAPRTRAVPTPSLEEVS